MADSRVVYEDDYGIVTDYEDLNIHEIKWTSGTSKMDRDTFNQWILEFAKGVKELDRSYALVDVLDAEFGEGVARDTEFRDTNVVPVYNEAPLKKFAFVMPTGMPLIGKEPSKEGHGPAKFYTAYFGSRQEAFAWLAE